MPAHQRWRVFFDPTRLLWKICSTESGLFGVFQTIEPISNPTDTVIIARGLYPFGKYDKDTDKRQTNKHVMEWVDLAIQMLQLKLLSICQSICPMLC